MRFHEAISILDAGIRTRLHHPRHAVATYAADTHEGAFEVVASCTRTRRQARRCVLRAVIDVIDTAGEVESLADQVAREMLAELEGQGRKAAG